MKELLIWRKTFSIIIHGLQPVRNALKSVIKLLQRNFIITTKSRKHTKQHCHSINGKYKVLCHSISYPHTSRNTDHCPTQITELQMQNRIFHGFDQELLTRAEKKK